MHHEISGGDHLDLEGRVWALLRRNQEKLTPQKSGRPVSKNCPAPGGERKLPSTPNTATMTAQSPLPQHCAAWVEEP